LSGLPLYTYLIAFALLVSFSIYIQPGKFPLYLKFFPPFLTITLVIEIRSFYMWNSGMQTYRLYNFFTLFEFCFYLFIISRIVNSFRVKKIITYTIIAYLILTMINISFFQKGTFHSITYSLGCLLIVTAAVYYFFELFQYPKSIRLTNEPSFWICSGLLFYYCCSFPFLGLASSLGSMPKILLNNVQTILNVINVLLYTLFTIAFLCRIKIRKYTSS
jgi:hypothetical protein